MAVFFYVILGYGQPLYLFFVLYRKKDPCGFHHTSVSLKIHRDSYILILGQDISIHTDFDRACLAVHGGRVAPH